MKSRWTGSALALSAGLGAAWLGSMVACNGATETAATGAAGSGGASGTATTGTTTAAGGSTTTGGDDCPDEQFLDVSAFAGAGAAYPKPALEVHCENGEVIVESNGIPHYEFVATTPNDLEEQVYAWHFPLVPKAAAAPTDIPLLGPAGVAANGMPIYGPNEAEMPDPYGDPVFNGIMDDCLGHTGANGTYHYHALLVACLTKVAGDTKPSPILAYAFDGYPVYGPYECADSTCGTTVELKSSWERTGDPSTYAWDNNKCTKATCDSPTGEYLDRCNGHTGPNGDYHYHATLAKDEPAYTGFPYILGCYHGTATNNAGGGMMTGGGPTGGGPTGGGGMLPACAPGQMQMCCGDGKCAGPETAMNCAADCG